MSALDPAGEDEAGRARALLSTMIRIRRLSARAAEMYGREKIRGFLHLYDGQEPIAAAIMRALRPEDAVVATYREHGQALARGIPARAIMAELFGKREGVSGGRGGSMHFFDVSRRFYGGNAIVGAGLPLAVGVALGDKLQGRPALTACFFGEGAVDEGEFHESMNLAALWGLPVLFVCENNLYSMGMALARAEAETNLVEKARSYRVEGASVDAMDVLAMDAAARRAVDVVRSGRPWFIECRTYRFRAHSMFDAQLYRDKAEIEQWREHDPLVTFPSLALAHGWLSAGDIERMTLLADDEMNDAVAFAEAGTLEPVEDLERHLVAPGRARPAPTSPALTSAAPTTAATTTAATTSAKTTAADAGRG